MKRKFTLLLFSLFLTLTLGSVERVSACDCVALSACLNYGLSDAVFVGKAVNVKKEKAKDESGKKLNLEYESTIFEIEETILGAEKKLFAVRNTFNTSCDTHFTLGGTYLIFARGDEKKGYGTQYCSGNAPLSEARELLADLRKLPLAGTGGKLSGSISEFRANEQKFVPIPDIEIKIEEIGGGNKIYKVVSDHEGNYELAIPQGKYKVTPAITTSGEIVPTSVDPLVLRDRGCAEQSFIIKNNKQTVIIKRKEIKIRRVPKR